MLLQSNKWHVRAEHNSDACMMNCLPLMANKSRRILATGPAENRVSADIFRNQKELKHKTMRNVYLNVYEMISRRSDLSILKTAPVMHYRIECFTVEFKGLSTCTYCLGLLCSIKKQLLKIVFKEIINTVSTHWCNIILLRQLIGKYMREYYYSVKEPNRIAFVSNINYTNVKHAE